MILTDIKFKTNLVHKKRADEPTRYQGQVIHNQSMDYAETCRRFAEYLHSNPIMARLYLDSVGGFIAEYVAKGYYLDLGPFTVLVCDPGPLHPGRQAPSLQTPRRLDHGFALTFDLGDFGLLF